MKLLHLRKEAAFQFNKTPSYQQHKHEIPLNSPEMQTFTTRLLVGSQMATQNDEDPAEHGAVYQIYRGYDHMDLNS